MNILITGCAGFIGFHLVKKISLIKNIHIIGIDNIDNYYDINLKKNRLKILSKINNFKFYKIDITSEKKLSNLFLQNNFEIVVNLAAQSGVRYSIVNPKKYFNNNILGFFNIINLSQKYRVKHFLFASTSSVYGDNIRTPFLESDNTDRPLSFYAASKKTNELIAYSFSNIYNLRCTALRFFSVYGPYGRPDMAYFSFTKAILNKKTIHLYNSGNHQRDFTYIDDVVNMMEKIIYKRPKKNNPYEVYNIGNSISIKIIDLIKCLEKEIKIKAKIKLVPKKLGDVIKTHANSLKISKKIKYYPKTTLSDGIKEFYHWYQSYFNK